MKPGRGTAAPATGRRRPRVEVVATLVAASLLLLWVAIVNGGPVVYPDSAAYLLDGGKIAHLTAPYAVRPVFYGVPLYLLSWGTWFGTALFVQALVIAHLLWLTLRAVGAGLRPGWFLALVLGLVVLTPVAWHVAHLLPDILVAAMVLALFLLGFCSDAVGRGERVYLVLLSAAAASFHLTGPPIALVLLVGVSAAWFWGDRRRVRPVWVGLPLVMALAGSLGFNGLVWHRLTLTPNSPPSLLARVLADGPGRDFLRARCPTENFVLCRYREQLPASEDGFMWVMLPALPVADGKQIKAEGGAVVIGTVTMFPWQVLGHMLTNTARQAVTFRSETQVSTAEWADFQRDGSALARATRDTLQARGWFERPRLDAINAVHAGVAGLSLLAGLGLLWRSVRMRAWRPAALLGSVLVVLAANAAVTGALNGVFARYEGRVIWLLPFAVTAAALAMRRGQPSGSDGAAAF